MRKNIVLVLAAFFLPMLAARAQSLLDETGMVVSPAAPSAILREFEVSSAGTYDLTITDFAVPGALTGTRAAVLRDGAIVRQLELGDTATATFDATAGTYALSIIATPGNTGIGTVGARVRHGQESPVLDFTGTISVPNPPSPDTHQVLDATFAVTEAGEYRVSLNDLAFPQSLASIQLTIVPEGGAPIATLAAAGQATFTANAGNYRLFAIANADASAGAGLYFTEVRGVVSGAAIYRRLSPVGRVSQIGGGLLAAGAHTLTATDLLLPMQLTTLKLAITSAGQLVARLDAAGTVDFTAAAAGHELLAVAMPGAGASGSYAADLRRGGAPVLNYVNTTSDGESVGAATFSGMVSADGNYRLRLTDFAFPQGFSALRAVVTQNGATAATLDAPGSRDVTLVAGTVNLLVFGQANQTGNGIYGVELRPATGTGATVIEGTRGVGSAFGAWQFSVITAGRLQVMADDLEFPARFAGFDAVVTRGPEVIGSFFGGGSFNFSATPGTYFINFIAKPGAQSGGAGTYRVRVATAPNLPTITLTADPARVAPGGTSRLQWTSTDVTQCTATGAWSGTKGATGNETTVAITAQTTFNLECVGPGGSSNTQAIVAVSSNSGGGGGGGGGRLSETFLLALLAAAALRAFTLRAKSPAQYRVDRRGC
ncbi:MAG: hypothetical protein ABI769_13120 [Pseudomonadota bacterium]